MSPRKSVAKKSANRPRFSLDSFRNDDANMADIDHYKNTSIVLERIVDIESLKDTFIPKVFKQRTWTKLLNPMGDVFEVIIKEFFANAFVEGDHINCWVRGKEFIVSRELIQEVLEIQPMTPDLVHPRNASFGLHHDLQPLSGEEFDNLVSTKDHLPT